MERSTPSLAPLHSSIGQIIHTCVLYLSPSSLIWYWPKGGDPYGW